MSAQQASVYGGPYWVVVGGNKAQTGVYKNQRYVTQIVVSAVMVLIFSSRPPNTALGRFRPLLPIVVTCKTLEQALQVHKLNAEIYNYVDAQDYSTNEWHILNSKLITDTLAGYDRFYAIRYGPETGIWVNFLWCVNNYVASLASRAHRPRNEIEYLTEDNNARYRGHKTFQDALLFMIDKEPFKSEAKRAASGPSKRVTFAVEDEAEDTVSPPP